MENKSEIPYFFNKEKSGFSEEDFELISPERFHFDDERLSDKLHNNFFEYKTIAKNNISFYYINYLIENETDLKNIHIRIFSEDKADFYVFKQQIEGTCSYRVISAKTTHDNIKEIKVIPSDDEELLQTINKTSIDTGAFWIFYKDVLKNIRTTNVRIELVKVLSDLRNKLKLKIQDDIHVQALIDRTLFIKFLEDRHIINSYFYGENIWYKDILKTKDPSAVNDLFRKVHKIFGNYLFKEPTIPENVLTNEVLQIIQNSIEGAKNGQLTLFDLKFDIIPIEAISQIYEIFFDDEQRAKGIYYTPKILTDFIVNLTIDKIGEVFDPACGSGAFLISAYKKLLKFTENKHVRVHEKIDFRVSLIKKFIYGIEKEEKARRLTIFALYLSILEDLTIDENKELKVFLMENPNYELFKENIGENIEPKNTFEPNKFDNSKFDFIIGNPPWKKDFKDACAEKYYEDNKEHFSGKSELSQLFQYKAKIWEKEDTRYGFVVNTSNFTNEYSKFQDFFYKNFTIEKFYEVSDLDFFTASEPAIVCIYKSQKATNNTLILNVLKSNEFSKLFKTVLIIEEDNISIEQNCLIKSHTLENVPLRNYLIGSEGDFKIINYLESKRFEKFENYILTDESNELFIKQGIKIYSKDHLEKVFNIKSKDLSDKEVEKLRDKFYE
ncbi:MAG: N-6 DNA methylase [Mariniphaga sp.]